MDGNDMAGIDNPVRGINHAYWLELGWELSKRGDGKVDMCVDTMTEITIYHIVWGWFSR